MKYSIFDLLSNFLEEKPKTIISPYHKSILAAIPALSTHRSAFEIDLSENSSDAVDTLICISISHIKNVLAYIQLQNKMSNSRTLVSISDFLSRITKCEAIIYEFDHIWIEIDKDPGNWISYFFGYESSFMDKNQWKDKVNAALMFSSFRNGTAFTPLQHTIISKLSLFSDFNLYPCEIGFMDRGCLDTHVKCLMTSNELINFKQMIEMDSSLTQLSTDNLNKIYSSGLFDSIMLIEHQCNISLSMYHGTTRIAFEITPNIKFHEFETSLNYWKSIARSVANFQGNRERILDRLNRSYAYEYHDIQSSVNHFKFSFSNSHFKAKAYLDCRFKLRGL